MRQWRSHCALGTLALAATLAWSGSASLGQTVIAQSQFESGIDGWWACGDATLTLPEWNPAGFIQSTDAAKGVGNFFVAPPKFGGPLSGAYGHTLTYEMQKLASSKGGGNVGVTLIGNGIELVYVVNQDPMLAPDWRLYSIELTETAGWVIAGSAAPPTREQFESALANVSALRINCDYANGTETNRLRNVVLNGNICNLSGDLDGDGDVDQADLGILLAFYGETCP
jgi:hypothetical protein